MQPTSSPYGLTTASCARLITGLGVLRQLPSTGSIKNQLHPLTSLTSPSESCARSRCLRPNRLRLSATSDFHEVSPLSAFLCVGQRPLRRIHLRSRSAFRFSQPLDGFFPPSAYRSFFIPDPLSGFPFQSLTRLSGLDRISSALSPPDVWLHSCRDFRPN
jgi:hypothetical protein